jgi:hypothetical protein
MNGYVALGSRYSERGKNGSLVESERYEYPSLLHDAHFCQMLKNMWRFVQQARHTLMRSYVHCYDVIYQGEVRNRATMG